MGGRGGAAPAATVDPADDHLAPWVREREKHRKDPTRPFAHLVWEFQREFPGVFFAPARWPTSDGVVPWDEFVVGARVLWSLRAIDRLNTARSIGVAFSGDTPEGTRIRAAEAAEAFPDGKQGR